MSNADSADDRTPTSTKPSTDREATGKYVPTNGLAMRDLPRFGSTHLSELISTRQDIADLRDEFFKPASKLARDVGYDGVRSKDLLPLTPVNDPLYLQPNHVEKGEWFAERFDALNPDEPKHPRGIHYELRGDDIPIPTAEGVETYRPDMWPMLTVGAKYALLTGSVPPERMKDEKNDPPNGKIKTTTEGNRRVERPTVPEDTEPDRVPYIVPGLWPDFGTSTPTPTTIKTVDEATFDDSDEKLDRFIDRHVRLIVRKSFGKANYKAANHQEWYIEVWCEKSNIIPDGIRQYDNVSTRPAKGGEFSFKMCYKAVQQAKQRDQNLVVIMLSDYDPKGGDMPKSVSRKVEQEAALGSDALGSYGPPIEAVVTHAALTAEQVERFDLPSNPVTSDDPGYSGQAALFENNAVEINALKSIHPDVLREAIENAIAPFVDSDLRERLKDAKERAEADAREALEELYAGERPELKDRQTGIALAFDDYNQELADEREALNERICEVNEEIEEYRERESEVRDETIGSSVTDLEKAARSVEYQDVLEGIETDLPTPNIDGPHGLADVPILDTKRTMGEQMDVYRHYDYRID